MAKSTWIQRVVWLGFLFSVCMSIISIDQIVIAATDFGLEQHVVAGYVPGWKAYEKAAAEGGEEAKREMIDVWTEWQNLSPAEQAGKTAPLAAPPKPSRLEFLLLNLYGFCIHSCFWPCAYGISGTTPRFIPFETRMYAMVSVIPVIFGYAWGIRAGIGPMDIFRFAFYAIQTLVLGWLTFVVEVVDEIDESSQKGA